MDKLFEGLPNRAEGHWHNKGNSKVLHAYLAREGGRSGVDSEVLVLLSGCVSGDQKPVINFE